ncbi:TPA: hypothetical protein OUD88_002887 [Enterobacter hormaechei]|nr:hypothetical protein [Enterobacter hormaechei]
MPIIDKVSKSKDGRRTFHMLEGEQETRRQVTQAKALADDKDNFYTRRLKKLVAKGSSWIC